MKHKDKATKQADDNFWSPQNLRSIAILIFLILCFRWSIASPYHVPTGSMEPTIKVGDRLLANKLAYDFKIPFTNNDLFSWSTPKRGDIIVFRYPEDPDIDYVKRVVGIAGDRIQYINDVLYINDVPQEQKDHNGDRSILEDVKDKELRRLYRETLDGTDHWMMLNVKNYLPSPWPPSGGSFTVPPASVFVSGDNRDNSQDSRVWNEVPLSYVRGKALFVIWSMYSDDSSMIPKFRWHRFGASLK